jgi:hypothetical protein
MSTLDVLNFICTPIMTLGAMLFILQSVGVEIPNLRKAEAGMSNRLKLSIGIFILLVSWSMTGVAFYRSYSPNYEVWQSPKQETVYAQTYLNQTVEVDGKVFDHCHFMNTKLLFHGRGPASFVQSDFSGVTYVGSDNIAIRNFEAMNTAIGKAPGTNRLNYWIEKDKNGNTVSVQ